MIKKILKLPFVVVRWDDENLNLFGKIVFGIPVYLVGMAICVFLLICMAFLDLLTVLFTKRREPLIGYETHRFGLLELWEDLRESGVAPENVRNLS